MKHITMWPERVPTYLALRPFNLFVKMTVKVLYFIVVVLVFIAENLIKVPHWIIADQVTFSESSGPYPTDDDLTGKS